VKPRSTTRRDFDECIERARSSRRCEVCVPCHPPHRIDKPQTHVGAFARRFNNDTPHQALADRTPAQSRRAPSSEDFASHVTRTRSPLHKSPRRNTFCQRAAVPAISTKRRTFPETAPRRIPTPRGLQLFRSRPSDGGRFHTSPNKRCGAWRKGRPGRREKAARAVTK
jgi:hypothetical protein